MQDDFYSDVVERISPLISELRTGCDNDRAGAIERFWAAVERVGAPVVEPIDGVADQVLVTFVWRDSRERENVALIENFSVVDPCGTPLGHIEGTDVWFRTFTMRSDLRFTYLFSVNDSLISVYEDRDAGDRFERFQRDPLNPRTSDVDFLEKMGMEADRAAYSYVELPGAASAPHVRYRDEIAHGTIVTSRFTSTILGNTRDIHVQTPAGYEKHDCPCSLLILFDGETAADMHLVPNTLDNLIADGAIPPTVCVMLTSDDRSIEYPCNEAFAAFVADELIPWIREAYRIAAGPDHVTACGVSYGGLASAWIALRRPDAVGNVLSHSGSFQWRPGMGRVGRERTNVIGEAPEYGWLASQVARWDTVPVRFFIEAGRLEALNAQVEPSLLACTRHVRDVLIAKGYDVRYQEYGGAHDFVNWRGSVADGLIHLVR